MARMEQTIGTYTALVGNPEGERDNLENLGLRGNVISNRLLKKSVGSAWTGLIWLTNGTSGGLS